MFQACVHQDKHSDVDKKLTGTVVVSVGIQCVDVRDAELGSGLLDQHIRVHGARQSKSFFHIKKALSSLFFSSFGCRAAHIHT